MSKEQWGHGYHSGVEDGKYVGRNQVMFAMNEANSVCKIDWIIHSLAYFFINKEEVEEVAISEAISILIRVRNQNKARIEAEKAEVSA